MATKSSPTAALDPLPGADPAILSIILTTEPMSPTEALKAFGEIDFTYVESNYEMLVIHLYIMTNASKTHPNRSRWQL